MLVSDRSVKKKGLETYQSYKVASGATIYFGALVCVNGDGYLVPAADAAGHVCVGLAEERVVNDGADGDRECKVYKGVARLPTSSANPVEQAHVGRAVLIVDDAEVAAGGVTENVVAGECYGVEPGYAWVRLG
jgi:predicted RecA/RadA family phage recombinase